MRTTQISSKGKTLLDRLVKLNQLQENLQKYFSSIGKESKHDRLIREIEVLEQGLLELVFQQDENVQAKKRIKVAVVGDFSSGKSSFINALLRENLCPVNVTPTTSSITYFHYGEKLFQEELPDGRRKKLSFREYEQRVQHGRTRQSHPFVFHVSVPNPILNRISLIDTPGFNNPKNEFDTKTTEEAVAVSDVLFVIMDIQKGNPSSPLLIQLEKIRGKASEIPAFLLINQADKQKSKVARKKVKQTNARKYKNLFRKIELISSKELFVPSEQKVLEALEKQIEVTKRAISARQKFTMTVSGSLQRVNNKASFAIDIAQEVKTLPVSSYSDFAGRDVLLEMVEEIVKERTPLLKKQMVRQISSFQHNWSSTLRSAENMLQQEVNKTRYSVKNSVSSKDFEILFQDNSRTIETLIHRILLESLEDTLSGYGYQITCNISSLLSNIQNHSSWSSVQRSLTRLTETIRYQYQITHHFHVENFQQNLKNTVKYNLKEIRNFLGMSNNQYTKTLYYNSEMRQKKQLQKIKNVFQSFTSGLKNDFIQKSLSSSFNEAREKIIKKQTHSKIRSSQTDEQVRILLQTIATLQAQGIRI